MSTIWSILERNPNWSELVRPERGYLHLEEPNHIRFVSASEPGWDVLFRYPSNHEISAAIDFIEIGKEIVVVLEEDASPDDEADYHLSYEVVPLPAAIAVPEE
jgi:hypothetical protein